MFTSVIRICAVVGITAVTFVGSMLRAKNENGPINQNSFNNGRPYNCNTGDDTMYNNNAYGSQQSRRFYGGYAPQQPMGYGYPAPMPQPQPQFQRPLSFGPSTLQPSPQLQAVLNQYGYQAPGFNNAYAASMNMYGYPQYPTYAQSMSSGYQMPATSRRNMNYGYGYPQQQQYQPQQYQMNNQSYGFNTPNPSTGIYRDPGYVEPAVQSLYNSNASYGFGGYNNQTQQQYGYDNNQQYQQNTMSYGYSQPMNFVNYNGIIGSAARYKCWCPSSSYGSTVYYGYDENLPSYPSTYQQAPPQFQQPPQQFPQQQFQQPYPYPQPVPPQIYPSPVYQSMNSVNESIRRRQMMEQQKQMAQQQEYMRRMGQMQRPQQVPPPNMSGRLSNDIPPIGNVDNGNGWFTPEELGQFNQPTPPPPPQQTQPVPPPSPQPMTVPEPNDSEISFDAMLNNNKNQEPIQYKSIDEAPVPTHIMTFGAPIAPENNIPNNIPVQQQQMAPPPNVAPQIPAGISLLS